MAPSLPFCTFNWPDKSTSIKFFDIYKPIPVPLPLAFVVKYGSKILLIKLSGIPPALSETIIITYLSFIFTENFG